MICSQVLLLHNDKQGHQAVCVTLSNLLKMNEHWFPAENWLYPETLFSQYSSILFLYENTEVFFEAIIGLRFSDLGRSLFHLHVKAKPIVEKLFLFFTRESFENQGKCQEI